MTRDEIYELNELTLGPAVAEHIMGWHLVDDTYYDADDQSTGWHRRSAYLLDDGEGQLWNPCFEPESWWLVVDHMLQRPGDPGRRFGLSYADGEWRAEFLNYEGYRNVGLYDSPGAAICRAALLAQMDIPELPD
ncbi:MAG: hypothetical protein PHQ60_16415 [Sideroxydans sp.]|nr:hypothetical protein [Sideroxydans sp.]